MKLQRTRRASRGFTLIELLVVIIILAILAAVVLPRVIGRTEDAKIAGAITTITNFSNQLEVYNADTGTFPTGDQGLNALVVNPGLPKWNGPYLRNVEKVPNDPWGNPFVFKQPGENGRDYDIISAGPDGQLGTSDDINSWNMNG